MSTYTQFAVAGGLTAGGVFSASLAGFISRALVAQKGTKIRVLSGASAVDSPASKKMAELGASIVAVDYDDPASLAQALEGVEVVVSALGGAGLRASQTPLAKAAKEAGVKLFVPSEFGNDTRGVGPSHPLAVKAHFQLFLRELGLPSTLFFNGPYADFIKTFMSYENDTVVVTGEGKVPISFTARADVASFLAHVLTHLPPADLANRTFLIEGSRSTYNDLVAVLHAKNPSLRVVQETHAEAMEKVAACSFVEWLRVEWDQGHGVVAKDERELANALFPGWSPKRVEEFL